jgi:hypothetical protein
VVKTKKMKEAIKKERKKNEKKNHQKGDEIFDRGTKTIKI